jgi:gas vesicle protein
MSKKRFKFLSGALLGLGLGVLFAPKKGEKTREELKIKLDELLQKIKEIDIEEVKLEAEAKISQIKKDLTELDEEHVLEVAKEKAKKIKDMAEELFDYVKEKGTPALEEAAELIRKKAVEVTKDVLKKLEEK